MHDSESQGAKARDHEHPRHHGVSQREHYARRMHRDWRAWVVVLLMVALTLVYVFSDSLSLRPGRRSTSPTPAVAAP